MVKSSYQSQQKHSAVGTLLFLMFAPLIWAVQFTIVYGGHTLICAFDGSDIAVKFTVFVATVAATLILGCFFYFHEKCANAMGAPTDRESGRAAHGISRILAGISMIAVLWTGATAALLTACVQGR